VRRLWLIPVAATFLMGLVLSIAGASRGGQTPQALGNVLTAVDAEDMEVRELIRTVFRGQGISYSIAPDIQGTVSVRMRNVTLDVALRNILRQVESTYLVEGGVVAIVPRTPGQAEPPIVEPNMQTPNPNVPSAVVQDVKFLYIFQGSRIYKVEKATMKIMSMGLLPDIRNP